MSHPSPSHDPENVYPIDDFLPGQKPKKRKPTIKTLKAMINQPASKEWFMKHGSKKSALSKAKTD